MPITKTRIITEKETAMTNESQDVKIAVMENNIKHIIESQSRIEQTLQIAISGFVTVDKLADVMKASDAAHDDIYGQLTSLRNWNTWATRSILLTVGTGLVTLGIYLLMAAIK